MFRFTSVRPWRRSRTRVSVLARSIGVALGALTCTTLPFWDVLPAAAGTPAVGPAGQAFYAPQTPLPAGKHGDLIWSRPLTTAAALPDAARNVLVLYRTTSVDGKDVAVSGTVAIPKGAPPAGGWPVIDWTHGTTGDAPQCAPSLDEPQGPEHFYVGVAETFLNDYVRRGYAIVQSDYEGQGTQGVHPYLIGVSEGRDAVDALRAARQLDASVGSRYVVMGHSQGGHSALFAASLTHDWAPELDLIGSVSLAPASHLVTWIQGLVKKTAPDGGFAFAALLMRGYGAVDPAIHLDRILTAPGLALLPQLADRCVPGLVQPDSWAGLVPAEAFLPNADLSALLHDVATNEPGMLRVPVPTLLLQGTADKTVAPFASDLLAKDLCANGVSLTYMSLPGVDHIPLISASHDATRAWIDARFAGSPVASNCASLPKAAS